MILTKCAYCAAPNALTKCGHCKTRYCGRDCQKLHWKGGHRAICQEIKRGGGAELYHANKKCTEAVALAVEKCAEDTKGQRCYICLEGGSEEGLVRGCACRGGSGFAHVSCLAEQAKITYAEAEENNLGEDAINARWGRWYACRLCEQHYHGVVQCALGWACWKTYVGRPETDQIRGVAMNVLGNGLSSAEHHEDALTVREAELSMLRRLGRSGEGMLVAQNNLAGTYRMLNRDEDVLSTSRDVYFGYAKLEGEESARTLQAANNYATSLCNLRHFDEAKALWRKMMPVARRILGEDHELMLQMRWHYAETLFRDPSAMLDDLHEAVSMLEETTLTARRVFGGAHPRAVGIERSLQNARGRLHFRESRAADA